MAARRAAIALHASRKRHGSAGQRFDPMAIIQQSAMKAARAARHVIPAKAGTHVAWVPAFAGMTMQEDARLALLPDP